MIEGAKVDLLALVLKENITLRGSQRNKYGPCPKCGGTDRFGVFAYDDRQFFRCRNCHEKPGDAIEYEQWRHGLTFGEALAAVGLKGEAPAHVATKPRPAKPTTAAGVEIPQDLDDPPAAAWQHTAAAFVDECAARLWTPAGAKTLDYLRARGLSDDTIRAYRLGWHWPAKAQGIMLAGNVWAARGIVIPRTYGGELWAVNVRRSKVDYDRADDGKKLMLLSGSKAQLFNGDTLAGDVSAALIFEGEIDCMLAHQHAPGGVAAVTYGSVSKGPTWELDRLLRGKSASIAFDSDPAGDEGAAKWAGIGPRVRVPHGKDLSDFAKAGGDVGAWMAETTGVYRWQPPADAGERIPQAKSWLAVFDDETQPGFIRARAWARMCVLAGETTASDGRPWLALAQ